MKHVLLQSIKLNNFKGVKNFELTLDGDSGKVFGDNAAGKTTLFDAFIWTLFDKDSNNKKDFAIKTLNKAGEEQNNTEHSVELKLAVDGQPLQLKKVYHEVWTKKRGVAVKEFGGHTTDFEVNEVPVNKKVYTAKVAEIVEEEIFKLLTSPAYFNVSVKWQDQRKILLEVCGNVSDEEVIASNKDLAKLNDLLSGKSLEEAKAIIASKRKKINEELVKIPVRIDEIYKSIPDGDSDSTQLKSDVQVIEIEIDALKTQKLNIQNGVAIADKKVKLSELEMSLSQYQRDFEAESKQEVFKLQARVQEEQGSVQVLQAQKNQIEFKVQTLTNEAQRVLAEKTRLEGLMNDLRTEFNELKTKQFNYVEGACECPTCKQALPAEQLQAARDEALAQFNEHKSNRQLEIKNIGNGHSAMVAELDAKLFTQSQLINDSNGELQNVLAQIELKQKDVGKYQKRLTDAQTAVPDVTKVTEYQLILTNINGIKEQIASLQSHAYEAAVDIDVLIREQLAKRDELNTQIAQIAGIEVSRNRIAELEADQQRLVQEFESLELQMHLIDEFTRTKVNMLNDRINSKFKHARFKLFEEQLNGGLNEVCKATFNGVPYGEGLNNAAKINIGLDIINTLSQHYGIVAPIFIDNAEAVTKLIETDAQMVSLIVSEKDKQLRVEVAATTLKEAI